MSSEVHPIRWEKGVLCLLDQRHLPFEETYIECRTVEETASAIQSMAVRGAPAIGCTAAFGMVFSADDLPEEPEETIKALEQAKKRLAETRPTAVNLFWALERVFRKAKEAVLENGRDVREVMLAEAQAIFQEDVESCRAIGEHGSSLLPAGVRIMTHCNAGALATAGYGTALGIIRSAHAKGLLGEVIACETRPRQQGARLTVWELMRESIPVRLISDTAAGYMMRSGLVNFIVVGADRIAANGDVANKIGTYNLAVLAKENRISFVVAAPSSTIDPEIESGDFIVIEERPSEEVTHISGQPITQEGVLVYNPAFDITPGRLINAIVTEHGVIRPPYLSSMSTLIRKHNLKVKKEPYESKALHQLAEVRKKEKGLLLELQEMGISTVADVLELDLRDQSRLPFELAQRYYPLIRLQDDLFRNMLEELGDRFVALAAPLKRVGATTIERILNISSEEMQQVWGMGPIKGDRLEELKKILIAKKGHTGITGLSLSEGLDFEGKKAGQSTLVESLLSQLEKQGLSDQPIWLLKRLTPVRMGMLERAQVATLGELAARAETLQEVKGMSRRSAQLLVKELNLLAQKGAAVYLLALPKAPETLDQLFLTVANRMTSKSQRKIFMEVVLAKTPMEEVVRSLNTTMSVLRVALSQVTAKVVRGGWCFLRPHQDAVVSMLKEHGGLLSMVEAVQKTSVGASWALDLMAYQFSPQLIRVIQSQLVVTADHLKVWEFAEGLTRLKERPHIAADPTKLFEAAVAELGWPSTQMTLEVFNRLYLEGEMDLGRRRGRRHTPSWR